MRSPRLLLLLILSFTPFVIRGQRFGFELDILGPQPEDFFAPTGFGVARLSPDATRLAYVQSSGNSRWVYVSDLDNLSERTPFFGEALSDEVITFLEWKDNERVVFQTSAGNVYFGDLDSRSSTLLFDASRVALFANAIVVDNFTLPRVLSLLPNDPDHLLLSAFDKGERQVYKLPFEKWEPDKKLKPFIRNPKGFDLWFTDTQGDARIAMKIGRNATELFYLPADSRSWAPLDRLLKEQDTLSFDLDAGNVTARRDYLLGVGASPEIVYFASNRKRNTTAVYRYDVSKPGEAEEIAYDPVYDLVDLTTGACAPLVDSATREWVGIIYHRDKPTTFWLDPTYSKIQDTIDGKLPQSSNIIEDWDAKASVFVVRAIYGSRPSELYLYRTTDDTIKPILVEPSKIGALDLPPKEPFVIDAGEGAALHGYFTSAFRPKSDPAPMVVLVHGGPWMRDVYDYDPMVQCLSYNSYSVLQVNYRGSTGYGYDHFFAASKRYGTAVLEDLRRAIDWSVQDGRAARDKVAIMGFSYGGYAAALAVAKIPDTFKCAIPMAGIYDLVFETKQMRKLHGDTLAFASWKQMVGSDWTDKAQLQAISPINLVEDIAAPILLAHGKLDEIAAIEHAELFQKALAKREKVFEYVVLEEEGHSLDLPRNQAYLFEKIVAFLDRHLGD